MANVTLKNIRKNYDKTEVIHGVDLDINSGEFIVFVGPSGCGKSTLLRMIAGLEDITEGEISIGGEIVNKIIAAERGVAMVFHFIHIVGLELVRRLSKKPNTIVTIPIQILVVGILSAQV